MSNIQVASNIWINASDPNGLGNNQHQAAKRLPGDLGVRLIVGLAPKSWDSRVVQQAVLDGSLSKNQVDEFLHYKFTMPHTHDRDEWMKNLFPTS